ncbi:MAG: PEP/pyruvate-binding domain-containing protein, partial [Pseudomonadota bacterium]
MNTVYPFGGSAPHSDPRQKDKTVTGGKGSNLAEMASIGLPVPPGFTITTEECVRYLQDGLGESGAFREDLRAEVMAVPGKALIPAGRRQALNRLIVETEVE